MRQAYEARVSFRFRTCNGEVNTLTGSIGSAGSIGSIGSLVWFYWFYGSGYGTEHALRPGMAVAKTFEELIAWQQAREFKRLVYQLSERPACRRDWDFRKQLRESAAGPPAHIAEGFARKRPRDFSRFLTIARSSLAEAENHLIDGIDRGMWKETELDAIRTHLKRAVSAIAKLQEYLNNCDPEFGSPNP